MFFKRQVSTAALARTLEEHEHLPQKSDRNRKKRTSIFPLKKSIFPPSIAHRKTIDISCSLATSPRALTVPDASWAETRCYHPSGYSALSHVSPAAVARGQSRSASETLEINQKERQRTHQQQAESLPASVSPAPFTVAAYDERGAFVAGGIDANGGGAPSG
jgi:hypothetical protein